MFSGTYLLLLLLAAIVFIIVATAALKIHPFLVLLVAAYGLGVAAGLPINETVEAIISGFASTLGYIGIVIAAGTIIGVILEKSGGAWVMARAITRLIGSKRSGVAMSVTGAVVSIPVFCDSGFVILSPLSRSLAATAGQSQAVLAIALSMGLYATHVFVPPTPGPIAAAGELGASLGLVIIVGLVVTIPVLITTYLFARTFGQTVNLRTDAANQPLPTPSSSALEVHARAPSTLAAFTPILAPVLLIALRSIAELPGEPFGSGALADALVFAGNPNTALLLGVGLAMLGARHHGVQVYSDWVGQALASAGAIILITGAGGALGSVLRTTALSDYLSSTLAAFDLGPFSVLLPFIVAAALKTALGSSTVAIITTAPLMAPLLPSLGLGSEIGAVLAVMAIGAGSMTVSHANDSYFWVVSQFSGMTVSQAYRLQTVGSAVAGVTGIVTVFFLQLLLT